MYQHILIAIDPDSKKTWERALPEAVKLATTHGATLHVMTVVPDYGSSLVASFFPANFEEKALEHAQALVQLVQFDIFVRFVSLLDGAGSAYHGRDADLLEQAGFGAEAHDIS